MGVNIAGVIAGTLLSFAQGGSFVACSPYGCRSTFVRPPIVMTYPQVIITSPPGVIGYKPYWSELPVQAPPPRNPRPAPPPRKDAEATDIEASIMDFCDQHPDERFCGKLGAYLRKHPDRK
jgi:hypothetical protein